MPGQPRIQCAARLYLPFFQKSHNHSFVRIFYLRKNGKKKKKK